jgi:hypothetical protein
MGCWHLPSAGRRCGKANRRHQAATGKYGCARRMWVLQRRLLTGLRCIGWTKKKYFFFEKKKQKTFAIWPLRGWTLRFQSGTNG